MIGVFKDLKLNFIILNKIIDTECRQSNAFIVKIFSFILYNSYLFSFYWSIVLPRHNKLFSIPFPLVLIIFALNRIVVWVLLSITSTWRHKYKFSFKNVERSVHICKSGRLWEAPRWINLRSITLSYLVVGLTKT